MLAAGRSAERLEVLAAETGARPFVLDATRAADVQASLAAAVEQFGELTGAANWVG